MPTPPPPAQTWAGVQDRPGRRLCDNEGDFRRILGLAAQAFQVSEQGLVRDYHMCRTLRSLFDANPPGAAFMDRYDDHKGRPVAKPIGPLLFAGGSSLTNAYRLSDRISEDIDLTVAASAEVESNNARRRIRRLAVIEAARACSPELPDDAHNPRTAGGGIGRRVITVGSTPNYLIAESSILRPFDPGLQAQLDQLRDHPFDVCRLAECQSLMGRATGADIHDVYPELAPFQVAALCVPLTAVNKLFALHRRAMQEPDEDSLSALAGRGRDIYDLWCIAQSPEHAAEVRASAALLAQHVHTKGATSEPPPRPAGGFSRSPAFDPATDQYAALQSGYHAVLALIWGRRPESFAAAIDAIKSLDPCPSEPESRL